MGDGKNGKLMAVKIYNYNDESNTFNYYDSIISVKLESFARGGMRQAHIGYRYTDFMDVVIKRDLGGDNNRNDTENDVRMQWRCQYLARKYNEYPVTTKKITFVDAFMVEFNGGPWNGEFALMEQYLEGSYQKHNSNFPAGRPLTPRRTPQAFSHFTYCFTNGKELVCDIQGVNDDYTDPQIHTDPFTNIYGKGNFGPDGIQTFVDHHVCSPICLALDLTSLGREVDQNDIEGTCTVPNIFSLKLEDFRRNTR